MKNFVIYALFVLAGILATIFIPILIGDCLQSQTLKLLIGGLVGFILSLGGAWITYAQTERQIKNLKDALEYEEDDHGNPSVTANPKWGKF